MGGNTTIYQLLCHYFDIIDYNFYNISIAVVDYKLKNMGVMVITFGLGFISSLYNLFGIKGFVVVVGGS
jgi:hypothetical protein